MNNLNTTFELLIQQQIEHENCKVIPTNSGTSALLCALYSCNVQEDEVVVGPNYGYFAWFNICRFLKYKTIIAEVNSSLDLSYDSVKKITDTYKVKVIFYVYHVGILDEDILKIRALCNEKGIYLIEDGCYSLGVKHSKYKPFSIGDISTLSFSEKKLIDSGEGGAIIVNNYNLYNKCMECQFQGNWHRSDKNVLNIGINVQMPYLIKKFIIDEFSNLPYRIQHRQTIFEAIKSYNLPIIADPNQTSPGRFILNSKNSPSALTFIKKIYKDKFDIEINCNYKSLSSLGFCTLPFNLDSNLLYLPVYSELTNNLLQFLAKKV